MTALGQTATQSTSAGLGSVDLALCVLYLFSVLCVGFYFTLKERRNRKTFRNQREQQQSQQAQATSNRRGGDVKHKPDDRVLEEYYLGGRRIPWWALGVADVSSYIDISGTMINTALVYALGVKGMYIEIRGGLCLFLAFQLAYTGKLSRRCPVKTRGEWYVLMSSESLYNGLHLLKAHGGFGYSCLCFIGSSSALATAATAFCCARSSRLHG